MVAQLPQIAGQVSSRRVAIMRVLGKAALDDPAKGVRELRSQAVERFGLLANDRRHRLRGGAAREGALPSRHLVEDRAQRELVGCEVRGATSCLFWRHVADGPQYDSRLGGLRHG